MYYPGVNRGLTLTSPGYYTIALIVMLGLIAIASGYNGIYISLSLGFSILVISGLLSEKVMRHFKVQKGDSITADAGSSFNTSLLVTNKSSRQELYGVECLAFTRPMKHSFFSQPEKPDFSATIIKLEAGATKEIVGTSRGLNRGAYRKLYVLQKTLFPFGLIAKFKQSQIDAEIYIVPKIDEELAERLRQDLHERLINQESESEFYSHRIYTPHDSIRHIDWKRSAGRNSDNWVLKVYESKTSEFDVIVELPDSEITACPDPKSYERLLELSRTACQVTQELKRSLWLRLGAVQEKGYENAMRALAEAPEFSQRHHLRIREKNHNPPTGRIVRLCLGLSGFHWE